MPEKDDFQQTTAVATTDITMPDPETVTENEAEEFARKLISRAATLNGVKINRETFLRTELKKHCPGADVDRAIETSPAEAGVPASAIDAIARSAVDFETGKCAELSFAAGIPGGAALVATVPAALVQYFAHVMRVEQKLAYIYGWQSFLNDNDEMDDETTMQLVLLMGVMLGVGGAAGAVNKFAANVAQAGVQKAIQRQALTKYAFYPIMKKVLRVVGVNLTKQTFAKTASKVVPLIGGVISGGLTYATFKPAAEHLRTYLRSLPTSGIADIPEKEGKRALDQIASGASEVASSAADHAQKAGSAVVECAQGAGAAAAQAAGVASQAAGAAAQAATNAAKSMASRIAAFGRK